MTESQEPTPTGAATGPGKPGRYSRSTGGLLGAMIVTVVVVLGWVGFRAVTTDT